ncbi:hypothetical protein [Cognatiyoonia sp. IB215182]|uniref:hypothetical protein n=1 Tax=Cognatiyoonia sp. IB215182 TaxID=3097353 RepID=UPI002A12BD19|nr:hypothetical protein [Cognatiyoonia sp. IB215182]MDX8355749.1 hypothetical protein [Cognatiyoonia sp. IB215182]
MRSQQTRISAADAAFILVARTVNQLIFLIRRNTLMQTTASVATRFVLVPSGVVPGLAMARLFPSRPATAKLETDHDDRNP